MLRKISNAVRGKDKEHHADTNGASNGVNGSSSKRRSFLPNGSNGTAERRKSGFSLGHSKTNDGEFPELTATEASPADVQKNVDQLMNLASHAMRPLPEGKDAKDEHDVHPTMFKELKSLGFKDVKTLKDKIAVGKDPIDDKTMLVCLASSDALNKLLLTARNRWSVSSSWSPSCRPTRSTARTSPTPSWTSCTTHCSTRRCLTSATTTSTARPTAASTTSCIRTSVGRLLV